MAEQLIGSAALRATLESLRTDQQQRTEIIDSTFGDHKDRIDALSDSIDALEGSVESADSQPISQTDIEYIWETS